MFRARPIFLKIFNYSFPLFLFTMWCFAGETPDPHYANAPANLLYERSTFAHGYVHGYEDGFHIGDEDYQMGRGVRTASVIHEYRLATAGYKSTFGDKAMFKKGYREGFSAGYGDSISNRTFRVITAARRASEGLKVDANSAVKPFDSGFASGYNAGQTGDPQLASCNNNSVDYCDGYLRGYRFASDAATITAAGLETKSAVLERVAKNRR